MTKRQTNTVKKGHQELRNILLAVGLIIIFIFIASSSAYIFQAHYGIACSCRVLLPIFAAILTSTGVFVGILTYYLLSKSFSKEKEKIYGNIEKTLNFLSPEEKSIVSALVNNEGALSQSSLSNITGIDSVKLHRRLSHLESRDIIRKEKKGITNKVYLEDNLKELFIQNRH